MTFETLLIDQPAEHVLRVTLNRPAVSNAMNTRMGEEITDAFAAIDGDDSCRCVILTGAGERAFCAGVDLKERRGMSNDAWLRQHVMFEHMMEVLLNCPLPVIAAVNGAAFAGGCELLLMCDFAYAVPNARFALTEVSLGIMPGGGGTQTLPRAIGARRAKEIILRAKPFSAGDALAWGLLNALHPAETLMNAAIEAAGDIAANAPMSIRQAKKSIAVGQQMDLRSAMAFEIEAYNRLVPTQDRQEGIDAFNQGRKPVFQGR